MPTLCQALLTTPRRFHTPATLSGGVGRVTSACSSTQGAVLSSKCMTNGFGEALAGMLVREPVLNAASFDG
eukprot:683826-Pelagomonas_calceolata.AAC.8